MYHHSGSYETAETSLNGGKSTNDLMTESHESKVSNLFKSTEITPVNPELHRTGSSNYSYSIPELYPRTQRDFSLYNNIDKPLNSANFRDPNDQLSPNFIADERIKSSNTCREKADPVLTWESSKTIQKSDTRDNIEIDGLRNTTDPPKLNLEPARRKNLENTVRLIENIIVNSEKSLTNNHNSDMLDPLDIKTEIVYNNEDNVEMETTEDVNSNVTTPQSFDTNLLVKIEPQSSDTLSEGNIEVKIEPSTNFLDADSNPFCLDMNGILHDHAGEFNVIEGSLSVEEATSAVQNDIHPEVYYECKNCQLLFRHAKRFLIHTKWHTIHETPKAIEVYTQKNETHIDVIATNKDNPRLNDNEKDKLMAGAVKVLPCMRCDKMFSAYTTLKHHQANCHTNENQRQCKICKIICETRTEHVKHTASHRSTDGFHCPHCPKKFKLSHSLYRHLDKHLEKVHQCNQCHRKYGSLKLLKMHLKRHEEAANAAAKFSCSYCGKKFSKSYNCKSHENTHRDDRKFTCELCKSTFRCNSSLIRHHRVSHSGSKPHVCSVCKRSFLNELTRDRHKLRAHGAGDPELMKFVCELCPSRYANHKDLQKHILKTHPAGKKRKKDESDSE